MPDLYQISVTIRLEADETKKTNAMNWLNTELTNRRNQGVIQEASISCVKVVVPETVTISPL